MRFDNGIIFVDNKEGPEGNDTRIRFKFLENSTRKEQWNNQIVDHGKCNKTN